MASSCAIPGLAHQLAIREAHWQSDYPSELTANLRQAVLIADLIATQTRTALQEFQRLLASTGEPMYNWHPKLLRCHSALKHQCARDSRSFVRALKALETATRKLTKTKKEPTCKIKNQAPTRLPAKPSPAATHFATAAAPTP